MDAQQFLSEFGHIASASEGVKRLREMILAIAVSGELVQHCATENARDLLTAVYAELSEYKLKYKYRRTTNKEETFAKDNCSRQMVQAPAHWLPVRLGQIGTLIRGVSYNKSVVISSPKEGYIGLLRGNNIGAEVNFYDLVYVPSDQVNEEQMLLAGDMLIAMSSGSNDLVGKAAQLTVSPSLTFGAFCGVFRCMSSVNCKFIRVLMQSPIYRNHVAEAGKGIGINNLTKGHIEDFCFSFPPKGEQARIVAKVDELMALCDQLEAQQQERSRMEAAARKAVLDDLTNVDTLSFLSAWERLDRNIGTLFGNPESIDDFEASLKVLAVRGLLTPTTDVEPDVDAIIQACTDLQDKYIAAKWMRKQKMILAGDSTVVYPSNWQVVPFDAVAVVIGGITKGRDLRGREVMTCPYLSVANVQRGFFKLGGIKTIDIPVEELGKYCVEDGDLMITEGGDWDKVGRTAIWHGSIENCLHQNHVFKARVPSTQLLNEWVELVFNSNVGRDYFAGASKQTTNLASINMTQLRSFSLPIPPLVEQKAILEKLAAMTATCKTWRSQREQAEKLSALLAAASVAALTGTRTEVPSHE